MTPGGGWRWRLCSPWRALARKPKRALAARHGAVTGLLDEPLHALLDRAGIFPH